MTMTISLPVAANQGQLSNLLSAGNGGQGSGVGSQLMELLFIGLLMEMMSKYGTSLSSGGSSWGGGTVQPAQQASDTVPTVSSNNAAQAVATDLEQRYGLTPAQAAGALGNIQQESGMQCNVNQGGRTGAPNGDCSGGAGYGMVQWDGSRKAGEIAYAKEHGLDPGSLQANIGYMNKELDGPYNKTIRDIKQTSTAAGAARVWETDYEQAGTPEMGNRVEYANAFLSKGL